MHCQKMVGLTIVSNQNLFTMTRSKLPKIRCLFLLLLLVSVLCHGQESVSRLAGIVVAENGEALNGVSVQLRQVGGRENKSSMTN
jgi:hypothetical protein